MGEHFAGESVDETRRREEEAARLEAEAKAAAEKAEADKAARLAEAADKINGGEFTGPELSTESLVDGGGQISIDRESYHRFIDEGAVERWFGKKAAEFSAEKGQGFFSVVESARSAASKFDRLPQEVKDEYLATGHMSSGDIEPSELDVLEGLGYFSQPDALSLGNARDFLSNLDDEERTRRIHAKADFLRLPYDKRKAFMASGELSDLTSGMSDDEAKAVRENFDYLRGCGFFAARTNSFEVNRSWQLPREEQLHDMMESTKRADDALNAFNSCSADARKRFLETGDVAILAEDAKKRVIEREKKLGKTDEEAAATAEKIAAATTEEMQFLQQEKFFTKKDQSKDAPDYPAVIDIDFRSSGATAENVSTVDLTEHSRGWFDSKEETERVDIVWAHAGGDEKLLDSLSDRDKELLERATSDEDKARILERAKKDWYESLPQAERDKMIGEYLDDYKKSIEVWNGIPEDKRRAYMRSGKVEDLAVMVEEGKDFDPNSEEGAQLVFCLEHLREMGAIEFGKDSSSKDERADAWRGAHDARADAYNEARDEEQHRKLIERYLETVNPETGAKYTQEEAEAEAEKEYKIRAEEARVAQHHRTIEELREKKIKSGELIYSDKEHTQVRPEVQRILDAQPKGEPKLTLEEAALLAQLSGDDRAYQKRLFMMGKRQEEEQRARAEGRTVNFAGVVDNYEGQHDKLYGAYRTDENGGRIFADNEGKSTAFYGTREEAKEAADKIGGKIAEFDRSEEAIGVDYENDSPEDAKKKIKQMYPRQVGEPQEEYDARIDKIYEAGYRNFLSDKVRKLAREWIDDPDTGFRQFLLSKGDKIFPDGSVRSVLSLVETTMDGDDIQALMDEYRPIKNRRQLKKMMGMNPKRVTDFLRGKAIDMGRSIDDLSDEEIKGYLSRIERADKERTYFTDTVLLGDDSNKLRQFILQHRPELQGVNASEQTRILEKMPYSAMADLMQAFQETTEGKLVAVSVDVSADLDSVAKRLSAAIYSEELERRGGWGIVGAMRQNAYRRRHNEESYVDLAKRYIETGQKGNEAIVKRLGRKGAAWFRSFREKQWSDYNRVMAFEMAAKGEATLGEGESLVLYKPKKDARTGEWSVVELADDGEKTASGPRATASIELMKAIEAYVVSENPRTGMEAFRKAIERINESLADDQKLSEQNFFSIAESAREQVDYGASIEAIDILIGYGVSNNNGVGYENARRLDGTLSTAHDMAIEKLVSIHSERMDSTPRIKVGEYSADDLVGRLKDEVDRINSGPAATRSREYRAKVLPLVAQIRLYEQLGSVSGNEREMGRLHYALDSATRAFGEKEEEVKAIVAQMESEPSDDLLSKLAEDYDDSELRIVVGDSERVTELSHGNPAFLTAAIAEWNNLPKERRFGELMGLHMTAEGMLLRELGILHTEGEPKTEVEFKGRTYTVGREEVLPMYGLFSNSIETAINANDGQLRTVINESETSVSLEDMRRAISIWNAAPAYARRLVLMDVESEHAVGYDRYEITPELKDAVEKLQGVFFDRSEDYRRTRLETNTRAYPDAFWLRLIDAGDWERPGTDEALTPEEIRQSQTIWNRTQPSVRRRLIAGESTTEDGADIPADVIFAYDVLDEARLVGDFMVEEGGTSPYDVLRNRADGKEGALNLWEGLSLEDRERAFADDRDGATVTGSRLANLVAWRRIKALGVSEEKAKTLSMAA